MQVSRAVILEIQQNFNADCQAVIKWSEDRTPLPGQYFQAFNTLEKDAPTAYTIFPGGLSSFEDHPDQIITAPPIPNTWNPGDQLLLRGPSGNGFSIPGGITRIALAAFGENSDHLLPLAGTGLSQGGEIALYTDNPFPQLPPSIEVNPLSALGDAVQWADYVACCTTLEQAAETRSILESFENLPNTQVLVLCSMPCGSLASCGICAHRSRSGEIKLVCEDGPVFNWRDL